MKDITAEEWALRFYERYYDDTGILRLCEKREQVESKWTRRTFNVLTQIGEDYGCKVTGEDSTAGGGRADQRWVRQKTSVVFIEHENRSENLTSEITKLCNDVSKLKVLLTYVADRKFRSNVERIKRQVKKSIQGHIGSFTGELLLMVSGYNDLDWDAFRYRVRGRGCKITSLELPKDEDDEHSS